MSIQSLVLIAEDRFGAVVFPLRSPLISSKLCLFYILVTWIIATATSSPHLFAFKVEGKMVCRYISALIEATTESTSFKIYILAIFIIFSYFPLLLIAIIYLKMILKLKSQKIPGEQPVNTREKRVKRERNVLKKSIAIVLVFAVCLFPFTIARLIFLFSSDRNLISFCGFQYFKSIASVLVRLYWAINPCICFIFSGNYRQGLKNILGGCSDDTRANQVTS